jgi:hypothetical protein
MLVGFDGIDRSTTRVRDHVIGAKEWSERAVRLVSAVFAMFQSKTEEYLPIGKYIPPQVPSSRRSLSSWQLGMAVEN